MKILLRTILALSLLFLCAADCNGPVPPEEEELWKKITVPEGMGYYALDFLSPTDGWSAGYKSIGHWNGESWTIIKEFDYNDYYYSFNDIFVISPDNIWLSGIKKWKDSGVQIGLVVHYDGENWIPYEIDGTEVMGKLWMFENGTGWAGEGGFSVYYFDGDNWSQYDELSLIYFYFFSPNNGWACGSGYIYKWDGNNWTLSIFDEGVRFRDIYFTSPDDGWVVSHPSLYGVAAHYHWDGTEWTKLQGTPFDEKSLDAVHFLNSDWGWVIDGYTYFYDGEHLIWKTYSDGTEYGADKHDIYCLNENDVWISAYPNFLHFTGFIE